MTQGLGPSPQTPLPAGEGLASYSRMKSAESKLCFGSNFTPPRGEGLYAQASAFRTRGAQLRGGARCDAEFQSREVAAGGDNRVAGQQGAYAGRRAGEDEIAGLELEQS